MAVNPLIAARPYETVIPPAYDGTTAWPLVVLLHGYGATAFVEDAVFGFTNFAPAGGFLGALPEGTTDAGGSQFWNATDQCCDFGSTGVDDVAYLNAVIDDMQARYRVDPKRVYVVGHSNGGFMSYRMACDAAPRIAAIMSLAGATWKDTSRCAPAAPVAVLQVHGDLDQEVAYGGTAGLPSAHESVADWAAYDGCAGAILATGQTFDLVDALPNAETFVEKYNCTSPGAAAELWTIHNAGHVPVFRQPQWMQTMWAWLSAHPKP
jgi:polyhydroxybutyrate depolymerase